MDREERKSDEARTDPVPFTSGWDVKGDGARRSGGPDVPMMQPADLWNRDDRTLGGFLSLSVLRRVAVQGRVAAGSVVVVDVASQQSPQM